MRHFFWMPLPVSLLPLCMRHASLEAALVTTARPLQRLPATNTGTTAGTIHLSPVAATTDTDLNTTALTEIQTIGGMDHRVPAAEGD